MLTDGRTPDAGVTGILIAHLGAFGSGELKIGSHNMTVLYPHLCYNEVSYKGTALYRAYPKIFVFYNSTKTYIVGSQKNRLNETVLLSTQNMLKLMAKKILILSPSKILFI